MVEYRYNKILECSMNNIEKNCVKQIKTDRSLLVLRRYREPGEEEEEEEAMSSQRAERLAARREQRELALAAREARRRQRLAEAGNNDNEAGRRKKKKKGGRSVGFPDWMRAVAPRREPYIAQVTHERHFDGHSFPAW